MKLITLTIALLFLSCGSKPEGHKTIEEIYPIIDKIETVNDNRIKNIRLYVIDSCEYIGYINAFYSDFLTHKGNCKFCAKRK